MNVINYDKRMQEIINNVKEQGKKLLLHACCAPCLSGVLDKVKDVFDLTVYFYNPNMDSTSEYEKRQEEIIKYCIDNDIKYVIERYNHQDFLSVALGKEHEKEGGKRCVECFNLRLNATAKSAKKMGYDYFATTLTVSPIKNATIINQTGYLIAEQIGVDYLPSDFKKRGGYQNSIENSKKYQMYRQNYCGCEFSKPKEQ